MIGLYRSMINSKLCKVVAVARDVRNVYEPLVVYRNCKDKDKTYFTQPIKTFNKLYYRVVKKEKIPPYNG